MSQRLLHTSPSFTIPTTTPRKSHPVSPFFPSLPRSATPFLSSTSSFLPSATHFQSPHHFPTTLRFKSTAVAPSSSIPFAEVFDGKDVLNHAYNEKEVLESIKPAHLQPRRFHQKIGYSTVQLARRFFDWISAYGDNMTEQKWIQRFIFLETVAGVPGMCAGMLRHLKSLRSMERDNGWITHLLDEAENERMHLLTFLTLRNPGFLFRALVIGAQGVFFNAYFVAYLLSPRTCHAFVGYLEEEAVKTYTHALQDIESGCLTHWQEQKAPEIAIHYWKLQEGATMKDLILAVRMDEAGHSHVNHKLSVISQEEVNPFVKDSTKIV